MTKIVILHTALLTQGDGIPTYFMVVWSIVSLGKSANAAFFLIRGVVGDSAMSDFFWLTWFFANFSLSKVTFTLILPSELDFESQLYFALTKYRFLTYKVFSGGKALTTPDTMSSAS